MVLGTAVRTGFSLGFLAASALHPEAVPESGRVTMIREHPSPTPGIAMSAISASCLVAVLDVLARDPDGHQVEAASGDASPAAAAPG